MEKSKKERRPPLILDLEIENLAYGGKGVARNDDFVWFVDKGLPGQHVKAQARRKKRRYGEAFIKEVITPSPDQIEPPCQHFGTCGGCQLQHYDYQAQINAKGQQVADLLHRVAGLTGLEVEPAIGAEHLYAYRNKMEFSFSNKRWLLGDDDEAPDNWALGLHVPRRFDKVLQIDHCLLQTDEANAVLKTVNEYAQSTKSDKLWAYDLKTHRGFWRFLVLRSGQLSGDLMVNVVTSSQFGDQGNAAMDTLAEIIKQKHPEVTTMLHSTTDKLAQAAFAEQSRVLFGSGYITEKIGKFTFDISPNAFFQTNSLQTETLFKVIADAAELTGEETVYDLYCGTGAIGIYLADKAKNVLGIEVIPEAIEDAKRNAELNNIDNIRFRLGDMKDAIRNQDQLTKQFGAPHIAILDPPRGGTHPKTIQHLMALDAPTIIYVSCNPSILARDLAVLCEKKYTPEIIQPVDMFPHTGHVEVVARLTRKK
ncbi:23S rRNA (uracil(1939)-C(5))-methyltransferase RlmD [bacterium]|nr:23S rRNA (uracil(1939)-C(5))-methyltransferase RlmD [bacterium]